MVKGEKMKDDGLTADVSYFVGGLRQVGGTRAVFLVERAVYFEAGAQCAAPHECHHFVLREGGTPEEELAEVATSGAAFVVAHGDIAQKHAFVDDLSLRIDVEKCASLGVAMREGDGVACLVVEGNLTDDAVARRAAVVGFMVTIDANARFLAVGLQCDDASAVAASQGNAECKGVDRWFGREGERLASGKKHVV